MTNNSQVQATQFTEEIFSQDKLLKLLGVKLLEGRPGYVRLQYEVKNDIVQRHRTCHGGIIFSLADAACGIAANSVNSAAVTQNCVITYLRPATIGTILIATAREKSRAGRSIILDAAVTDNNGTTIAELRGTARQIQKGSL